MLTLYDLTVSHFCEKARWALQYKGLEYRSRRLVPGYHILTTRRVAGTRTVPVLTDGDSGAVVADSTDILHYLDRREPSPALFPSDPEAAARVARIEEFFDESCAPHVSGFAYYHLLSVPAAVGRIWRRGLSLPQRMLLRPSMPALRTGLRRVRGLGPEAAAEHHRRLQEAVGQLERWIESSGPDGYLVGGSFSAADLTAAAVLGPLARPPGSPWDPRGAAEGGPAIPEIERLAADFAARPAGDWVLRIWSRHRRRE